MDESTQTEILCHNCSCIIEDEDDAVLIDGHLYCQDCTFICDYCNEAELISNQHQIDRNDNMVVCDSCFNDEVSACSICENLELRDDLSDVDGCFVCESCLQNNTSVCDACQEVHLDENIVQTCDDQTLCRDCADEDGYTEECSVCFYRAREQDIAECSADFNEALKSVVELSHQDTEFDWQIESKKICKSCQKQLLSVQICIGTGQNRINLEAQFPKSKQWLTRLDDMTDDAKIAIISDASYSMVPTMGNNGGNVQWVQKILTHVDLQWISDEVYNKLMELDNAVVFTEITTKRDLEQRLVRALNEQDIYAFKLPDSQVRYQAEYNWRRNYPDEEVPLTTVWEIEMLAFDRAITAIGDQRLNEICPGWENKRLQLRERISEHNQSVSQRVIELDNNTRGDNMRCPLCNSIIDENNKVVNDAGVCQRCVYGEMCPECKRQGHPTCPDCLINYGKQKNKMETTLFQLSNNTTVKRYHDPADSFIKTTKLRTSDEKPYLYYGVELEMCVPMSMSTNSFAKEMLKAGKGLFVAENDSSLDNGVEFISRPLSYKRWKSPEVQQILEEMKGIALRHGYDQMSQDSAGMHVHLSSLFFQKNTTKSKNEQIDDLNWIIQNYEKELRPITGREPGAYNRSMFTNIERDLKMFIEARNIKQATITTKIDKTRIPMDHHSLVSMSGSGNTVEVRAFKGTCDPLTIMARIELCRNLAHFARKYNIENMTLDKAFNCKQSPFLEQYVKNNKIEVDSKKKLKSTQNVKIEVKNS